MYSTTTHSPASSSDLYSASDEEEPSKRVPSAPRESSNSSSHDSDTLENEDLEIDRHNSLPGANMDRTVTQQEMVDIERDFGHGPPGPERFPHGTLKRKRDSVQNATPPEPREIPSSNFQGQPNLEKTDAPCSSLLDRHPNSSSVSVGDKRIKTHEEAGATGQTDSLHLVVRVSADGPQSLLPAKLWRRMFCFVPPVFLGRLLRVNRAFNALLTPGNSSGDSSPGASVKSMEPPSPETIWTASRRRFCPGLPKPIRGSSELDMWRLLRGSNCQLCAAKQNLMTTDSGLSPWESGPGNLGVRVVWPFGTRCCGTCLRKNIETVCSGPPTLWNDLIFGS